MREKGSDMNEPRKPDHVSQQDWDDADIKEWTAEQFAQARPFKEVLPEVFDSWKRGRGRPKVQTPKVHVGFRLAADVVSGIKATGPGYNARVEKVLRNALDRGTL